MEAWAYHVISVNSTKFHCSMIFVIVNILFPTFQVARWTNGSVLSCESLGNDANSEFVSSVPGDAGGNVKANLTLKFRLQNIKCDVFSPFSCYSVYLFLHFACLFCCFPWAPSPSQEFSEMRSYTFSINYTSLSFIILQEQSCWTSFCCYFIGV